SARLITCLVGRRLQRPVWHPWVSARVIVPALLPLRDPFVASTPVNGGHGRGHCVGSSSVEGATEALDMQVTGRGQRTFSAGLLGLMFAAALLLAIVLLDSRPAIAEQAGESG